MKNIVTGIAYALTNVLDISIIPYISTLKEYNDMCL